MPKMMSARQKIGRKRVAGQTVRPTRAPGKIGPLPVLSAAQKVQIARAVHLDIPVAELQADEQPATVVIEQEVENGT